MFKSILAFLALVLLGCSDRGAPPPPNPSLQRASSENDLLQVGDDEDLPFEIIGPPSLEEGARLQAANGKALDGPSKKKPAVSILIPRDDTRKHDWTSFKPPFTSLNLTESVLDEPDIVRMAALEDLETLILSRTNFTDDALARISKLTKLRVLHLDTTSVTDAGLKHFREMKHLQWLDLCHTQVSSDGLEHLSQLTELTDLFLHGTQITDEGLFHLRNLKRLKWLGVDSTRVTKAGADALRAHLPRVNILLSSQAQNDPGE